MKDTNSCFFITGANSGVGFNLIIEILKTETHRKNSTFILGCRSEAKAIYAINRILTSYRNVPRLKERLLYINLDLNDIESVFECCKKVRSSFCRIDYLILNAGFIPIVGLDFSPRNFLDLVTNPSWVFTTG
ncbi:3-keto-steroid reductase, partial [Lobulomyces angularis]